MLKIQSLFLILASTFLLAPERGKAESPPAVKLPLKVVDSDWAPFFFKGESNKLPGFAKEILNLCLPKTPYQADFQFLPIARLFTDLKEGNVDIAIMAKNEEREQFLAFGEQAIFNLSYRVFVKKGSSHKVEKFADLDKLRLGHLLGLKYPTEEFTKYVDARKNLTSFKTPEAGLRLLMDGRIDAFVGIQESVLYEAQEKGLLSNLQALEFEVFTAPYFITVSSRSPRVSDKSLLLKQLDACLLDLMESGKMSELKSKYGQ